MMTKRPEIWTTMQVRDELAKLARAVGTQRVLAAKMGISQQYLSDIITGRRPEPGPAVLEYLGLRRAYVKVGA